MIEWIAAGAAFGIKAFFALCCCAVLGMLAVLTMALGGDDR